MIREKPALINFILQYIFHRWPFMQSVPNPIRAESQVPRLACLAHPSEHTNLRGQTADLIGQIAVTPYKWATKCTYDYIVSLHYGQRAGMCGQ